MSLKLGGSFWLSFKTHQPDAHPNGCQGHRLGACSAGAAGAGAASAAGAPVKYTTEKRGGCGRQNPVNVRIGGTWVFIRPKVEA